MGEGALIGIDIGTSSVKAVMVGAGGARLESYAARYPTHRPAPGAAEQDPADWLTHVEAALARFAAHPRAGEVAAIGVTSQVNTHVFCDSAGRPLAPAITWQDTRAASDGAALQARMPAEDMIAAIGAPIPLDASHALSRMAYMIRTAPDVWAETAAVLAPKDVAIAALTGVLAADPLSSIGLVDTAHRYAPAVLDLVPGATERLAPLHDPIDIVGTVRAGRPFAGVPVAAGMMDAYASMFGLGVADEGEAMYLSGSSEVMGLISAARTGAPGTITFPPWRGITLHAAPTQSGGAALDWVARLLGQEVDRIDALAAQVVLSADSPLFLPHLEGERAPLWDSLSRGAFAGLASATGPAELAAAVMEGVAFSARLALEALERSGGRNVPALSLGGGGAVSPVWNQIRADALNRPLTRVDAPEAGAMGALVLAGAASGVAPDLIAATCALVVTDRVFTPRPDAAARAEERYGRFRELYEALAPLHHGMA